MTVKSLKMIPFALNTSLLFFFPKSSVKVLPGLEEQHKHNCENSSVNIKRNCVCGGGHREGETVMGQENEPGVHRLGAARDTKIIE